MRKCVPIPKKVYEGAKRACIIEEVELYFPGFKAFIDVNEQENPKTEERREEEEDALLREEDESRM